VNTNGEARGYSDLLQCVIFLEEVRVNMWIIFQLFKEYKLLFMISLWRSFMLWNMLGRRAFKCFGRGSDSSLVCRVFFFFEQW